VVYNIVVQSPQYTVDSMNALLNIPVGVAANNNGTPPQLLGNLVTAQPARQLPIVSRYNIAPAIDVYVSVQGTDLASVAGEVRKLVDEIRPKLKRGSQVELRGQVQTMQNSFAGLGVGPGDGDRAGVPAGGGELPVVDRRRHHHRRAARGAGRHRVDAVHHRHHAQRAGAHRRHHDHGRGHGQLHPGGVVRAPAARAGFGRWPPRRPPAPPASARC
jgi:hypothetical protein